jgi:hypothetical protein
MVLDQPFPPGLIEVLIQCQIQCPCLWSMTDERL